MRSTKKHIDKIQWVQKYKFFERNCFWYMKDDAAEQPQAIPIHIRGAQPA
jgi:hypothetical protein